MSFNITSLFRVKNSFVLTFALLILQNNVRGNENDECGSAIPLIVGGEATIGSTITSDEINNSVNIIQCDGENFNPTTPGSWYEVIGTGTRLRASTCGEQTNFTHRITVFETDEDDSCDNLPCRYSGTESDPNCTNPDATSVEWDTEIGEKYYLLIHGRFSNLWGSYELSLVDVTEPPENDSCDTAIELEETVTASSTTKGATFSAGVKCSRCIDGGPQNPGVWFRIPSFSNESEVSISTCSLANQYYFNSSIFFGDSCGEFYCHEFESKYDSSCENDDSVGITVTFQAAANQDYYVYAYAEDDEMEEDIQEIGEFGIAFFRSELDVLDDISAGNGILTFSLVLNALILSFGIL